MGSRIKPPLPSIFPYLHILPDCTSIYTAQLLSLLNQTRSIAIWRSSQLTYIHNLNPHTSVFETTKSLYTGFDGGGIFFTQVLGEFVVYVPYAWYACIWQSYSIAN